MARTKISEFSSTPANNTDIDSINIAEGCAPSNINDAIRELMAQLKDFQTGAVGDSFNGPIGSSTASTGAFTNITASGTLGVTGVATLGAGAILNTPASVTLTNATGLPISTGVSGLGTGVATALAVNVGSAGAPVVNGGALGTPSSGTVTNLTGTASININGTVGATTPTTGAFTTLSASSSVTLSGGTANGVTYLNGSKVLTSGSALTFDGTNLGVGTSSPLGFANYSGITINGSTGSLFALNGGGTNYFQMYWNGSLVGLNSVLSNPMAFYINNTESMRLTSTGLGIGTSSPSSKLSIAASTTAANADIELGNSAGVKNYVFTGGSTNATTRWRNNLVLYTGGAQDILFETNATERMRLDSSGNLGIGTSSPAEKLTVNGNIRVSGGNALYLYNATNDGLGIWYNPAGAGVSQLTARVNGADRLTIDSAGNLGLGVTPSAWASSFKVLQLANGTSLSNNGQTSYYQIGANNYYDGTNYRYIASNYAGFHRFSNAGAYEWHTAATGTAGDAISFSQAMTLNSSGQLLVGTTNGISNWNNSLIKMRVENGIQFGNYSAIAEDLFDIDSLGICCDSTENIVFGQYNVSTATYTERARIDSSGNFCYGVQSFSAASNGFLVSADGSSTYTAHANGTSSGATYSFFYYNNSAIGSITQSGTTAVLYNTTSDQRLKENIQDADSASSLIDSLQVRKFDWKSDGTHQRYGFVAQELVTVAPEAVHQPTDTEEMMAVDYSKLVPMLVKEIQSLRQRVAQLETN